VAANESVNQLEDLGGIEAIRQRLLIQRDEIMRLYEQDVRAGQEASDEGSDDIVDRANNAYNRELLFSLSDGERVTLLRIEEALERLEGGTYGVCANCGKDIRSGRLKAVPWARYCIDCQELAEKGMLEEG
jgi:DnaK suppressor protein